MARADQAPVEGEEARPTQSNLDPEVLEALEAAKLNPPTHEMVKRIAKVTAARKEEEFKRQQLEQELEKLRAQVKQGVPASEEEPAAPRAHQDPEAPKGLFSDHPEMRRVTTTLQQVEGIIRWARDNPDGGPLPDGSDSPVEYTASQVEAILQNAIDQRTDLRADRRVLEARLKDEAMRKAEEEHGKALETYPWMADPETQEFRVATALIERFGITPEVQLRMPDWRLMIGDLVAGRLAREGRGAARQAAPALTPSRAPMATEPTHQPGRPAGQRRRSAEEAVLEEADVQFAQTGSTRALGAKLAARRRARQASA